MLLLADVTGERSRSRGPAVQTSLFVGNLASHEDGRVLAEVFAAYGTVVYAKLIADPDPVHPHGGCGVVRMSTAAEADRALRALHQSELGGHPIEVRAATAAEETAAGHPRLFGTMNMSGNAEEAS
jgi:hypothetical protein